LQRNQAKQIQKQRKRTKKISAAAESDFIIAGKQAEFAHSTQAKKHKLCCVEQAYRALKKMLQAKAGR